MSNNPLRETAFPRNPDFPAGKSSILGSSPAGGSSETQLRVSDSEFLMRECLRLAKKGRGWVNPNPMVGALVVKNGKVVGKGFHRKFGAPHAEAEALRAAGARARGATLYTNLEPCCHFGHTPPCTESIIRAGIARVVISTKDPDPRVRGRGIAALRGAGINIISGVLEKEARSLNEAFFTFHQKRRPFVVLKFATSLDGKLATTSGESKWITSSLARLRARDVRSEYQGILVGISTILKDDPHLGARLKGRRDPIRIIVDSALRIPLRAEVLRDSNTLVVTTKRAPKKKKRILEEAGIEVYCVEGKQVSIPGLLKILQKKKIISVLVEGGAELLGSFVDEGIADKVYAFYAPILLGGRDALTIAGNGIPAIQNAIRFENVAIERFRDDVLIIGSR